MKLLTFLLLITTSVSAQKFPQTVNTWYRFWGVNHDSVMQIPRVITQVRYRDSGDMYYNAPDSSIYWYTGHQFRTFSGGGATSPAPPFTSVQFNNSGVFGGSSSLEWDNTDKSLHSDSVMTFQEEIKTDTLLLDKIHFGEQQSDTAGAGNKYGSYRIAQQEGFLNADGQKDVVISFGYNTKTDVTPVNPNEGVSALTMESHYIPFVGSRPQFETYFTAVARDGHSSRPIGFNVGKDTGDVIVNFQTNAFQVATPNYYADPNRESYFALGDGQLILQPSNMLLAGNQNLIVQASKAGLEVQAQGDGSGITKILQTGIGGSNPVLQFTGGPVQFNGNFGYGGQVFDFLGAGATVSFGVSGASGVDVLQVSSGGKVLVNKDLKVSGTDNGYNLQIVGNQSIADNGATPAAAAIMDIASTTKGLAVPRMTTTQKNAIASPVEGLIIYDLTLHKLCIYTGSAWETITSL